VSERTISASHDPRAPFYLALDESLRRREMRLDQICCLDDAVSRRVLEDYGAVFIAADSVRVPPACVFSGEEQVRAFQDAAGICAATLGGVEIELQPVAANALLDARDEARHEGFEITPRGGVEAARRGFDDTLRLWHSRIQPALDYWCVRGRLAPERADDLRRLAPCEQVSAVLELEVEGIFFSKDFSKIVLYSVAAPGTSQHLSMLAFDVVEFREPAVRRALASHGWFQTVIGDLPHFTFIGREEQQLIAHGLRRVEADGQIFWIPDV